MTSGYGMIWVRLKMRDLPPIGQFMQIKPKKKYKHEAWNLGFVVCSAPVGLNQSGIPTYFLKGSASWVMGPVLLPSQKPSVG